jgi:Arc/MetJ-type ribon-helix-helix transcriptional regulator
MITKDLMKQNPSAKRKEEKNDTLLLDIYIQNAYNICMNTQTFNISLPRDLVKKVDKFAKQDYLNRSDFIREALLTRIREKQEWKQIFKAGRETAKRMGIKSEKQINDIVYELRHGRKPN